MAAISRLLVWGRRRARALPSIAWRDRKIDELSAARRESAREVEELRRRNADLSARIDAVKVASVKTVEIPSFRHYLFAQRRLDGHLRALNGSDRGTRVNHKLRSYSFAQSWGVAIPEIYAICDRVDDFAWDNLPDSVVIKSSSGAFARGVLPLTRVPGGWSIVTEPGTVTTAEVVERFRRRERDGAVRGPFIAQEYLGTVNPPRVPVDVKFYTFYGEVGMANLRSVTSHLDPLGATFRTLDRSGTDLGSIYMSDFHNPDIPVPEDYGALVACAERLSSAIPRAFVRVDLYEVGGRVVFGELTPRPGGKELFPRELDERLGHLWERAQARLLNDAIDGSGYALKFGPGPRELLVAGTPYLPA